MSGNNNGGSGRVLMALLGIAILIVGLILVSQGSYSMGLRG